MAMDFVCHFLCHFVVVVVVIHDMISYVFFLYGRHGNGCVYAYMLRYEQCFFHLFFSDRSFFFVWMNGHVGLRHVNATSI